MVGKRRVGRCGRMDFDGNKVFEIGYRLLKVGMGNV